MFWTTGEAGDTVALLPPCFSTAIGRNEQGTSPGKTSSSDDCSIFLGGHLVTGDVETFVINKKTGAQVRWTDKTARLPARCEGTERGIVAARGTCVYNP